MRKMVQVCSLLIASVLSAQTAVDSLVQSDTAKMKGMSAEESFSYVKRTYTMRAIEAVGPVLEAYLATHGRYPAAASMSELAAALGTSSENFPRSDKWGTELRYVVSGDGKRYSIASAGGDRTFDEKSWTRAGALATDDDDAVFVNGAFTRMWADATKPGAGPRGQLNSGARALLEKADSQLAANDRAGALASYIEAVKVDARAADLEAIRRYAPAAFLAAPPPPPPPPPPPGAASRPAPPQSPAPTSDAKATHIAALRQYLELHPADSNATKDLLGVLPPAEAMKLTDEVVSAEPQNPDVYATRAVLRLKGGRHLDAVSDFEKAASLDASNPERHYQLGTVLYEVATKSHANDPARAGEMLRRSLSALERAETLRPDYREALVYRSMVLRELGSLETDAAARQKLVDEADAVRARVVELMKKGR